MDPGEQTTGTRDEHYDLIAVLYHALHGAETIETYVLDAEAAGDERLAAFFREAQATHRQLAERAKGLLGLEGVTPGAGEALPGTTASRDIPPTTGVPRTPPGDVERGIPPDPSPRTGDVPPRSADVQGWETPPPPPRRESAGGSTRAPGDVQREETPPPVAPPGRGPVPPGAPRTGDIPPPGEEEPRPEDPTPGP